MSIPCRWLTKRYGPAPIGRARKPSAPTCSKYFRGSTIPAAVAVVP